MIERSNSFFSQLKECLNPDDYLFSSKPLQEAREELLDQQKIIFLDANGVLCTLAAPYEANPSANFTISCLKDAGYYLVLWTKADQVLLEIMQDLEIDLSPFSMIFTADDYARKTPKRQQLFAQAVNDCGWIKPEIKNNLIEDHPRLKTPVLLTNQPFLLIQDNLGYTRDRQAIDPNWCVDLYPYGGGPFANWRNLPVFGSWILEYIERKQVFIR